MMLRTQIHTLFAANCHSNVNTFTFIRFDTQEGEASSYPGGEKKAIRGIVTGGAIWAIKASLSSSEETMEKT